MLYIISLPCRITASEGGHVVLVIGSSGMIGRAVSKLLLDEGFVVHGVDKREGVISDANYIHHRSLESVPPTSRVYMLAGYPCPRYYLENPFSTIENSTALLFEVIRYAYTNKARLLFTSSSEVYSDTMSLMTEDAIGDIDLEHPRACYKELKRFSEVVIHNARREYGIETRIVRIFNTYGKSHEDDTRIVPMIINSILHKKRLIIYGDGLQKRSFCHVDDTARGILTVMESTIEEPVNIGNPYEVYSVKQLVSLFELISGVKINVEYVNDDAMIGPMVRIPDIRRAQSLGWQPSISIESGIRKVINAYTCCDVSTVDRKKG